MREISQCTQFSLNIQYVILLPAVDVFEDVGMLAVRRHFGQVLQDLDLFMQAQSVNRKQKS